MWCVATLPCER